MMHLSFLHHKVGYHDEHMLTDLRREMLQVLCRVLLPLFISPSIIRLSPLFPLHVSHIHILKLILVCIFN